jgi:uncharacterized protein (DUF58 family)
MTREELLKKITTFPIAADKISSGLLSGGFQSVFQAQGMEFSEVRPYQDGDDVRYFDNNVSARFGKTYIKMYTEEREIPIFAALDCSASMFASSLGDVSRYEQALFVCALLGFSAVKAQQRFGATFFDVSAKKTFRASFGMANVMTIISSAIDIADTVGSIMGTNMAQAISNLSTLCERKSFAVIISDFQAAGFERELAILSRRCRTLAVKITDPIDRELPKTGLLYVRDYENPQAGNVKINTFSRASRAAWRKWNTERSAVFKAACQRYGAHSIEISTTDDAPAMLANYFRGARGR